MGLIRENCKYQKEHATMMYITHMLLVWQYFYLKLTIRDNESSIWNHGTTINFGLSGIMVLLFHMVLLMIGAKIHNGT